MAGPFDSESSAERERERERERETCACSASVLHNEILTSEMGTRVEL